MSQILLIEADRLVAKNLSSALKRVGHQVDWQVDPQVAMDSADRSHPDLVILDLLLAGRGGVEFLHEFRSYPEWQSLPIILFSHVSHEELGETATSLDDLGIVAYLHKPVTSLSGVTEAVEQAIAALTAA